VWSIPERVRGVCIDALYKSTYTLLYLNKKLLMVVQSTQRHTARIVFQLFINSKIPLKN